MEGLDLDDPLVTLCADTRVASVSVGQFLEVPASNKAFVAAPFTLKIEAS